MQTIASTPACSQTPAPWLLSGALEPTQIVDEARTARLDDSGGLVEPRGSFGVRTDACYRRFGAEGGRPGLTAEHLEAARVGLDRHRGAQWRQTDVDTIAEIRHRSAVPEDFGARAGNEIPAWFRCEGSDGVRVVPRRLQPLVAIVWWAYASGRFGVLASTVELGTELGVDPRTIRSWRAECVRLGLLRHGMHRLVGGDGVEVAHLEVDRTWRPGKHKRPCDRARNLYRPGPVLEAFAGDTVTQRPGRPPKGKGGARVAARAARKAGGALRRASRLAAYRRTGEVWDRETGRVRSPSTTPAPRGPRPVSADRMARTQLISAAQRPTRAPSTSIAIARIKDPGTPDPNGPSEVRGLGPRTPDSRRSASGNAVARSSTASSAAPPLRGRSAFQPPPNTHLRPEPPPGRKARAVPTATRSKREQRPAAFAELMATTAAAGGWTLEPEDIDSG